MTHKGEDDDEDKGRISLGTFIRKKPKGDVEKWSTIDIIIMVQR